MIYCIKLFSHLLVEIEGNTLTLFQCLFDESFFWSFKSLSVGFHKRRTHLHRKRALGDRSGCDRKLRYATKITKLKVAVLVAAILVILMVAGNNSCWFFRITNCKKIHNRWHFLALVAGDPSLSPRSQKIRIRRAAMKESDGSHLGHPAIHLPMDI